jgi:hypothetical protein
MSIYRHWVDFKMLDAGASPKTLSARLDTKTVPTPQSPGFEVPYESTSFVCIQAHFEKFHLRSGDVFEAVEFAESGWVSIWGRDFVYVVSDYPYGSEWVNVVRRHPPAANS